MKKVLILAASFCSFLFLGCDNFLEGSEIKNKIDETVYESRFEPLEIDSFLPQMSAEGVYCDSSIIITFSKKTQSTDSKRLQLYKNYR